MGNNSSREVRSPDLPTSHGNHEILGASSQSASPADRNHSQMQSPRPGRGNRSDLFVLGMGSTSNTLVPERRETKQEREARKLEKERQTRLKERERSFKVESVDGGFLVTMGVYTGVEDYNKAVVRQLMIERKIAPFWRGLSEYSNSWSETQLIAAGRGLPIPAADEIPEKDTSQIISNTNSNYSGLGLSSSAQCVYSDSKTSISDTIAGSPTSKGLVLDAVPDSSPSGPLPLQKLANQNLTSMLSPFANTTQASDSSGTFSREFKLLRDPYVNGQPIEVLLYKNAIDCPICFLSYPPYLNKTRCCDQPMCSECFVQIKRLDPHPPDQHNSSSNQISEFPTAELESLVSEPACCPYCQQPELGVIYQPPEFRRGLIYTDISHGQSGPAHDTQTLSINSNKKQTTPVSVNESTVITTDRIRPDWAIKLAGARSHIARKSAAATALHNAAYLIGNENPSTAGFNFRSSRLVRGLGGDGASGSTSTTQKGHDNTRSPSGKAPTSRKEPQKNEVLSRRDRVQEIEELMMMEAIRLSLAAEEERKKRVEKENIKEAKKKAKDYKKRERREKKGGTENSASGSSLSLNIPSMGKRRDNIIAATQLKEIACDDSVLPSSKGKEVDRRPVSDSTSSTPSGLYGSKNPKSTSHWNQHICQPHENVYLAAVDEDYSELPHSPGKDNRDHQISNVSSSTSSLSRSISDSPHQKPDKCYLSVPVESLHKISNDLASNSVGTPVNSECNSRTELEPLLNFQSLTAIILHDDENDYIKPENTTSNPQDEKSDHTGSNLKNRTEKDQSLIANASNLTLSQSDEIDMETDKFMIAQRANPEITDTPRSSKLINADVKKEDFRIDSGSLAAKDVTK